MVSVLGQGPLSTAMAIILRSTTMPAVGWPAAPEGAQPIQASKPSLCNFAA